MRQTATKLSISIYLSSSLLFNFFIFFLVFLSFRSVDSILLFFSFVLDSASSSSSLFRLTDYVYRNTHTHSLPEQTDELNAAAQTSTTNFNSMKGREEKSNQLTFHTPLATTHTDSIRCGAAGPWVGFSAHIFRFFCGILCSKARASSVTAASIWRNPSRINKTIIPYLSQKVYNIFPKLTMTMA